MKKMINMYYTNSVAKFGVPIILFALTFMLLHHRSPHFHTLPQNTHNTSVPIQQNLGLNLISLISSKIVFNFFTNVE